MNIRRKFVVTAILLGLLFSFGLSETFAGCGKCGMGEEKVEAVTGASPITLEAEVICLGCSLKKEQGAKAQCSIYGHRNALRADGEIWTILENDEATELINSHEYAGKIVKIEGKSFPGTHIIQVGSFEVIEE